MVEDWKNITETEAEARVQLVLRECVPRLTERVRDKAGQQAEIASSKPLGLLPCAHPSCSVTTPAVSYASTHTHLAEHDVTSFPPLYDGEALDARLERVAAYRRSWGALKEAHQVRQHTGPSDPQVHCLPSAHSNNHPTLPPASLSW